MSEAGVVTEDFPTNEESVATCIEQARESQVSGTRWCETFWCWLFSVCKENSVKQWTKSSGKVTVVNVLENVVPTFFPKCCFFDGSQGLKVYLASDVSVMTRELWRSLLELLRGYSTLEELQQIPGTEEECSLHSLIDVWLERDVYRS